MTGQLAIVKKIQFLIDKASRKTKATQRSSALQVLSSVLEETEKLSDVSQKVLYLNDIANIYATLGLTEKCMEVLNQAFKDAQGIEYDSNKASELSKISSTATNLSRDSGQEGSSSFSSSLPLPRLREVWHLLN